ncbi:MAG TPA: protein translocase SEC61 complex subunit gamma [Candidatus Aenigmarchaeota archaeon]|nr:MAG: protein translocase SEC61 complex subunit gamma [Candidatus Aenigmarchaeota archaeon]HDD46334.1 protein translocase SEC61 complex subunit gamma [Candidatus Aenigmarchaeota archaeon]
MINIREIIRNYTRVLQIARKPDKEEFVLTSKICAIGLFIIGVIGFSIFIAFIVLRL